MKLRDIFLSWDFISSVVLTIILFFISPVQIKGAFLKDFMEWVFPFCL